MNVYMQSVHDSLTESEVINKMKLPERNGK